MEHESTQKQRMQVILAAILTTLNEVPNAPSGILYAGLGATYDVNYTEYSQALSALVNNGFVYQINNTLSLTPVGAATAQRIEAVIAKRRDATGDNVPYAGEDGGTASVKRQDAELRRMIGEGS